MISSRGRFIFVHIPKTAGSSITYALRKHFDRENRVQRFANSVSKRTIGRKLFEISRFQPLDNHATAREYLEYLGDRFWDYKTFAFVRNPYDLQVSLFHYIQQTPFHPAHSSVSNMDFPEFLFWRCHEDPSLRAQTDFLLDENGYSLVARTGRFETIGSDFADICDYVGAKVDFPHKNPSKRGKYSEYYNAELTDLVAKTFERDFQLLGYGTDPGVQETTAMALRPHPKLVV